MGAPRKQRRKYETPTHPWQEDRIEKEKEILRIYGLKNKKEIWKMDSTLRRFKRQVKSLVTKESEQAKKEEKQLLDKLIKLGLIGKDAKLEDVLGLETKSILDRRLQSMVLKKGLANSVKQARQFITHGHILIGDKKISAPSYLVLKNEEDKIKFSQSSTLASTEHPERAIKVKKPKGKVVRVIKKK